jgi:hypothetical protein
LVAFMTLLALLVLGCGCGDDDAAAVPFEVRIVPREIGDAVPGQRLLLLVTIDGESSEAVNISAEVDGATTQLAATTTPGEALDVTVTIDADLAFEDQPPLIGGAESGEGDGDRPDPGQVTVVTEPTPGPGEMTPRTLELTVTGTRHALQSSDTATITVRPARQSPLTEYATTMRDLWVEWLGTNHPEHSIDTSTPWEPYPIRPNTAVVSYFIWVSDDWEMGLTWHVTRPGDDWTRIYLRPRNEIAPRFGYQIDSQAAALAGDPTPSGEIEPPTEIHR